MRPSPALRCLFVSSLALAACHRRRAHRPPGPSWVVRPADGPVRRVRPGLAMRGALRAEGRSVARPPYPASALVAAAELANHRWRFAAEDGSVYEAPTFTGPLELRGAAPVRLLPAHVASGSDALSAGCLVARDALGRALRLDDADAPRVLAEGAALSVCAASAEELFVVSEPGVLRRSIDGGRTFAVLRAPAGVPLAVSLVDGAPRLRSTAGSFRWDGRSFAPDATDTANVGDAAVEALRSAAAFDDVLPSTGGALARLDGRRLARVEGSSLAVLDAATLRVLERRELPGEGCALHGSFAGLRAVCRHGGWATFVAGFDAASGRWATLRDELRAEPMGPVAFDDASGAWAVAAPCTQHPTHDPLEVCLYGADGAPRTVRVATPRRSLSVRAGVVREGADVAPAGAVRTVRRDDGVVFAWGATASTLAATHDGARVALGSPVHGSPATLALDVRGAAYCAGPWCRLGDSLLLGPAGATSARVLARDDAPPSVAAPDAPPAAFSCAFAGPPSPAVEIDDGPAVSGYAVAAALHGATLTVTWTGDVVHGSMRAELPDAAGARVFVRGVQGATAPEALVELCDDGRCRHLRATTAGVTDLALGRGRPGGVELQRLRSGDEALRVDDVRDGVELVTVVRLDADGAPGVRRTFALAGAHEDASVGTWDGRAGLWVRGPSATLRFFEADPADTTGTVHATVHAPGPGTSACGAGVAARGEVHVTDRGAQVSGLGWFVEAGSWQQDQTVDVDVAGACVRAFSAGEQRVEDGSAEGAEEPARSVVLRAVNGVLEGFAWGGEARRPLRCTVRGRPE